MWDFSAALVHLDMSMKGSETPILADNLYVLVNGIVPTALSMAQEYTINGRPGISLRSRLVSPLWNFLNQHCAVYTVTVPPPSTWHFFTASGAINSPFQ